MSRLVLISNKQCDGKDLACAGQTLAADAEPGCGSAGTATCRISRSARSVAANAPVTIR